MRLDKYLWCIRYYKTRSIATEACKKGHIRVNGETAKPSKEVFPQDEIQIKKDQITYRIQVNDLPESRVGAKLVSLYCTDHTPQEAFEQAKQFTAATEVNALAVTKLDGTAKGGVVIGISDQFKIPVKYIGLGEVLEDLQLFRKKEFVDSLFGE